MKKIMLLVFISSLFIFITGCQNDKKIYKFDFFDGYIPGTTYSGEINLKSGNTILNIDYGCSVVGGCGETHFEYLGKLSENQLKKVNQILDQTNNKDSGELMIAIKLILEGNKSPCYEDDIDKSCIQLGQEQLDYILNNI